MVRRPSVIRPSTISNIFSSETTWPIKAKFYVEPPWVGGTRDCSRYLGHMTKMAVTPIYGKKNTFKPQALDVWTDFFYFIIIFFFSFSHVLRAQLAFHAIRFNKHTLIILFSIFSLHLKYTCVYVYFRRREDINKKYYNCVFIESINMEG